MSKTIITISGPSFSGKTTLAKLLEQSEVKQVPTVTTRTARSNEVNGVDYFFIEKEEFLQLIKKNEMLEYTKNNGNYYGLSKRVISSILDTASVVSVILDPDGVNKLKLFCNNNDINIKTIFINNPLDVLCKRFLTRFLEDHNHSIDVYAKKILSALTHEQTNWVMPALNSTVKYDYIIDAFNKNNEDIVLKKISELTPIPIIKKKRFQPNALKTNNLIL